MNPKQLDEAFPVIPFDWLVEGLWQKWKINMITGYVKSGKSRLTNWLLSGLSKGTVLDNLSCYKPKRILYLAGEEVVEHVNQRLANYATLQGVELEKLANIDFIFATGMKLNLDWYQKWLGPKLRDYDLLVIDPLRRVHSADENDNTEMAAVNTVIRQWSNDMDLSMVIIHHTPKPSEYADMNRMENWIRGAGDIAAIVDTAMFVEKMANGRIMVRREGRYAPLGPLFVQDNGNDPDMGFLRAYDDGLKRVKGEKEFAP
jgi:RecA-family ATPase